MILKNTELTRGISTYLHHYEALLQKVQRLQVLYLLSYEVWDSVYQLIKKCRLIH